MCKVMVVDDEPLVREAISHVISSEFDSVHIAGSTGSGDRAVDLARQEQPDIIIMDIRLDDRDGLSAIEEIKNFLPGTVMVVISAYDSFSYARQALRLGVADYMLKPLNKQDIIDLIDNACLRVETEKNFAGRSYGPDTGTGSAGAEDEPGIPGDYSGDIPLEKERELMRYIDMENYARASDKMEEIARAAGENLEGEELIGYCRELLIVVMRKAFSSSGVDSVEFTHHFKREEMIGAIRSAPDGESALEILQDQVRRLLNYLTRNHRQGQSQDVLQEVRRFIDENYSSDITLAGVAREAGLSKSYLSRRFKRRFQVSFSTYLNQLRIDEARRLLRSTDMSVREIAAEVGFNDSNYFSRVFKKEEGLTPTEYRQPEHTG